MKLYFPLALVVLCLTASGQEPQRKYPYTFPEGDGCNTCTIDAPGAPARCTLVFCEREDWKFMPAPPSKEKNTCFSFADGKRCVPLPEMGQWGERISALEAKNAALEARVKELEQWKKAWDILRQMDLDKLNKQWKRQEAKVVCGPAYMGLKPGECKTFPTTPVRP